MEITSRDREYTIVEQATRFSATEYWSAEEVLEMLRKELRSWDDGGYGEFGYRLVDDISRRLSWMLTRGLEEHFYKGVVQDMVHERVQFGLDWEERVSSTGVSLKCTYYCDVTDNQMKTLNEWKGKE